MGRKCHKKNNDKLGGGGGKEVGGSDGGAGESSSHLSEELASLRLGTEVAGPSSSKSEDRTTRTPSNCKTDSTQVQNGAMAEKGAAPSNDAGPGSDKTKKKGKPKLLSIFVLPEEVWELILRELKENKDLTNCCRASPYLDMILTKTKLVWQFKEALPFIRDRLTDADLINCRGVCTQWKTDIDNLYQEERYDPSFNEEEGWYAFLSIADMDTFLQSFSNQNHHPSPSNPFVDRTVFISNEDEDVGFTPKVSEFMDTFGEHIRKLTLRDLHLDPYAFYNLIQSVFTKAPNLRHVLIDGHALDMHGWADLLREVSMWMVDNPLPFMASLDSLWLRPTSGCPENIHKMIMMRYATQLKSLSMGMNYFHPFYDRGLINLNELFLDNVSSNFELGFLLRLKSPIENLRLIISALEISLPLLIKLFCKFPTNYIQLLCGEHTQITDPEGEAPALINHMRNSKVQTFEISHGPKFSYNFLRIFPSLQSLIVGLQEDIPTYCDGGVEEESEEDVQFWRMVKIAPPYYSNVWTLFPWFEDVEIYDNSGRQLPSPFLTPFRRYGTRKGWEEWQERDRRPASSRHQGIDSELCF